MLMNFETKSIWKRWVWFLLDMVIPRLLEAEALRNVCAGIIVGWSSNWERNSFTIESGNWNSHLRSRASSSVFHPFHAAGSYWRFRWPWEICRWRTQHRRCHSFRKRLQRSTWSRFRYLSFETNNVVGFPNS